MKCHVNSQSKCKWSGNVDCNADHASYNYWNVSNNILDCSFAFKSLTLFIVIFGGNQNYFYESQQWKSVLKPVHNILRKLSDQIQLQL